MPARATKDRLLAEFVSRPDNSLVIGDSPMAIEARIPSLAAFEFDRDDIDRRLPMLAARLGIDLNSLNLASVNHSHV